MALTITDEGGKAADSRTWDSLKCEGCGLEILIPPGASDKIICPSCRKVNDKSEFMPLARTLWVSKRERIKKHSEDCRFSCVHHYRQAARFRRAIFGLYDRQGYINWAQAIALLIAFHIDLENGVLKLLEGNREISFHRYPKSPFIDRLRQHDADQETTFEPSALGDEDISRTIVSLLSETDIKRSRGNQARSDILVLMLDAVVLRFCPNSYIHLLRDALRLRPTEYKKTYTEGARAKRKAWGRFYKARRGVEASCRRTWKRLFSESPPSLGESDYPRATGGEHDADKARCDEWWIVVARQQGMMELGV